MAEAASYQAEVLNGQTDQGSGDSPRQTAKVVEKPEEKSDSDSLEQEEKEDEKADEKQPETDNKVETKVKEKTMNKEPELSEQVNSIEDKIEDKVPDSDEKTEDVVEQTEAETAENVTEKEQEKSEEVEEEKEPEFEDILGSGSLLKKVVKKGSGKKPRMGDRVKVSWTREIPASGKTFPVEELTFIAGDGDVVQALDLIVVLISEGDVVEVKASHRFMYGEIGLPPDVPPMADFEFNIEILENTGTVDYDKLDFDARFDEAKAKKERGNFLFKRKDYSLALTSYRTASKIVDPDMGCVYPDESPEKLQELLEFRAVVLCNTSVSQLRCDAHEAAVKSAMEATKLSPSYSKAYFRLGQAYEKTGQIDETIKAYKTALKYDPENSKVLHGELARLTKVNRKAKESEQKMYSKMFWGDKPPTLGDKDSPRDSKSGGSLMWKVAAALAGVVGLASIGMYKYMNH